MSSIWEKKYSSQSRATPLPSSSSSTPQTATPVYGDAATKSVINSLAQSLDVDQWASAVQSSAKLHAAQAMHSLTSDLHKRPPSSTNAAMPYRHQPFANSHMPSLAVSASPITISTLVPPPPPPPLPTAPSPTASAFLSVKSPNTNSNTNSNSFNKSLMGTNAAVAPKWPAAANVQDTYVEDYEEEDDDPFAAHDRDRTQRVKKSPRNAAPSPRSSASSSTAATASLIDRDVDNSLLSALLRKAKNNAETPSSSYPASTPLSNSSRSNSSSSSSSTSIPRQEQNMNGSQANAIVTAWRMQSEIDDEADSIKRRAQYENKMKSDGVLPMKLSSPKSTSTAPSSSSLPPPSRTSNPLFTMPLVLEDMLSEDAGRPHSVGSGRRENQPDSHSQPVVSVTLPKKKKKDKSKSSSKSSSSSHSKLSNMEVMDIDEELEGDNGRLILTSNLNKTYKLDDITEESESAANTARSAANTARGGKDAHLPPQASPRVAVSPAPSSQQQQQPATTSTRPPSFLASASLSKFRSTSSASAKHPTSSSSIASDGSTIIYATENSTLPSPNSINNKIFSIDKQFNLPEKELIEKSKLKHQDRLEKSWNTSTKVARAASSQNAESGAKDANAAVPATTTNNVETKTFSPPTNTSKRSSDRKEREDLTRLNQRVSEKVTTLQAHIRTHTLKRVLNTWAQQACLPPEKHLQSRAFASFHLLLRCLTRWRKIARQTRGKRKEKKTELATRKEQILVTRAINFYRIKYLHKFFRTWFTLTSIVSNEREVERKRNERAKKMEKLLQSLGNQKSGKQQQLEEEEEREEKHEPPNKAKFASPQKPLSATQKHSQQSSISQTQKHASSSHKSKALSSTTTTAPSTEPPAPPAGYKDKLVAERGHISASAGLARAAAAVMGSPAGTASNSNAHSSSTPLSPSQPPPPPSLPPTEPASTNTSSFPFYVASGETMSARAELRKKRRAELDKHYAEVEMRKEAEKQEKIRKEEEEKERLKQEEILKRREKKRQEQQKEMQRLQMNELEKEKLNLAVMHAQRSSIYFYGWQPWRKYIESAKIRRNNQLQQYLTVVKKRVWRAWRKGVVILKKENEIRLEQMEKLAKERYRRRCLNRLFLQWNKIIIVRKHQLESMFLHREAYLQRNVALAWRAVARAAGSARKQREARLQDRIDALASRVLRRHYFLIWKRSINLVKITKNIKKMQTESIQNKIDGWLQEIKANKNSAAASSSKVEEESIQEEKSSSASSSSFLSAFSSTAAPSSSTSISSSFSKPSFGFTVPSLSIPTSATPPLDSASTASSTTASLPSSAVLKSASSSSSPSPTESFTLVSQSSSHTVHNYADFIASLSPRAAALARDSQMRMGSQMFSGNNNNNNNLKAGSGSESKQQTSDVKLKEKTAPRQPIVIPTATIASAGATSPLPSHSSFIPVSTTVNAQQQTASSFFTRPLLASPSRSASDSASSPAAVSSSSFTIGTIAPSPREREREKERQRKMVKFDLDEREEDKKSNKPAPSYSPSSTMPVPYSTYSNVQPIHSSYYYSSPAPLSSTTSLPLHSPPHGGGNSFSLIQQARAKANEIDRVDNSPIFNSYNHLGLGVGTPLTLSQQRPVSPSPSFPFSPSSPPHSPTSPSSSSAASFVANNPFSVSPATKSSAETLAKAREKRREQMKNVGNWSGAV